jgi:ribosomal protein S18 acetylase RimI-like enzyme
MNRKPVSIRRARPGDLERLVDLWQMLHAGHYAYDREYYRLRPMRQARAASRKYTSERISDRKSVFLVAVERRTVVGYLMGTLAPRPPVMPQTRTFFLNSVFVLPRLRGRGICSQLFVELCRRLRRRRGVKHVELNVDVRNPAVSVYEHLGFEKAHYKMVRVLRRRARPGAAARKKPVGR